LTLFAPRDHGSSTEACGPHRADPRFHRAIQTSRLNGKITEIFSEPVIEHATEILKMLAATRPAASESAAATAN
jgi:hypothetical protein